MAFWEVKGGTVRRKENGRVVVYKKGGQFKASEFEVKNKRDLLILIRHEKHEQEAHAEIEKEEDAQFLLVVTGKGWYNVENSKTGAFLSEVNLRRVDAENLMNQAASELVEDGDQEREEGGSIESINAVMQRG